MEQVERIALVDFDRPFERSSGPAAFPARFQLAAFGLDLPARFLAASRLDPLTLRRSEDAFVDELFCLRRTGAPLVRAHFPRAYLDVNREP